MIADDVEEGVDQNKTKSHADASVVKLTLVDPAYMVGLRFTTEVTLDRLGGSVVRNTHQISTAMVYGQSFSSTRQAFRRQ